VPRHVGLGPRGASRLGRTWIRNRVWLDIGDEPDRRGPPDSKREKGEERGRAGLGRLGHARVKKKEKGLLGWALQEERERGEKERESGPGQERKRGRKRNAFEYIQI
jgi:hypothetical protein